MTYRKKLIEVSLPLEAINEASSREKSIRQGHPSTLHLWWSRKPLATCRAVLFSSLIDDPSEYMPDETSANVERDRLFGLIEQLVLWENLGNEDLLDKARLEIARSVARDLGIDPPVGKASISKFLAEKAPPVLDPFAGGGSIPLEAQRLGLRAYATDLNPVAVLINKALIEIPPNFTDMPPVHPPESSTSMSKGNKGSGQVPFWQKEWNGAEGLAEDVRYYGMWMRNEAVNRIGHLYPNIRITSSMLRQRNDLLKGGFKEGDDLTIIAWIWARTIKCPNPACGAEMPLLNSLSLSTKRGNQIWLEPETNKNSIPPRINFQIKTGQSGPISSPKVGRGAQFRCLACDQIASEESLRTEFKAKRNGFQLVAIVADSRIGRIYLPSLDQQQSLRHFPQNPIGFQNKR